tara:strand:- start:9446 stop:9724 length:279 start_codon:yes stop_codon:yes gene_type:complete
MSIDCVGFRFADSFGRKVGDDLVTEEIEINPLGGGSTLTTAQQAFVKAARGLEVVYRKGEVKGTDGFLTHLKLHVLMMPLKYRFTSANKNDI